MKTFKVGFEEVIHHEFYVEAETKEDALNEFQWMGLDGELDFSDGEVVGTTITYIEEI